MSGPILLPNKPALRSDRLRMLDWGGRLEAPNGGPTLTLLRLGTRHALDITPPAMRAEPHGRIWSSRLRQAKLAGALVRFTQDGFTSRIHGSPVVNGAGQAGSLLAVRGAGIRAHFGEGEAISLVHRGRRYLHFVAEPQTLLTGAGVLSIFPMLRVIPDDGDVIEFAEKLKIEGSLSGNEVAWDRSKDGMFDFGTITITEDA
ncbi:hypothetical protein [Sphingomonas sp. 3-13AW]|uniref:hypothetical protein n=1 Tax=Sphingomonas sp. 3-13AW TaxID=3050450 RepID=UPI003BB4CCCE